MTRAEAIRFRDHINTIIETLDDDDALNVSDLFPGWRIGEDYYGPNDQSHPQSRIQYEGYLYKCLQNHTAQEGWEPDVAVSLWYHIDNPQEEWPEWVQPIGAGTGYDLGAKVSHNNKHWINVGKDDNEYEPGVWGWDEVPITE